VLKEALVKAVQEANNLFGYLFTKDRIDIIPTAIRNNTDSRLRDIENLIKKIDKKLDRIKGDQEGEQAPYGQGAPPLWSEVAARAIQN